MLVPRQIHQWLVDKYQGRGYQFIFMTRAQSGGVLLHAACTYMWRDLADLETEEVVRQGITIGYDESELSYVLWYDQTCKPQVNDVGRPDIKGVYLANPDLFNTLSKVVSLHEPHLQNYSHICRPETSEGEEGPATPRDQITGSRHDC